MLITKAFPTRGTRPASPGLVHLRGRHLNADGAGWEELSDRANCSARHKSSAGFGGQQNIMSVSTTNGNKNPKEGWPEGQSQGGKMA